MYTFAEFILGAMIVAGIGAIWRALTTQPPAASWTFKQYDDGSITLISPSGDLLCRPASYWQQFNSGTKEGSPDALLTALVDAQRALQMLGSPTHMADFIKGELEIPTRQTFAQRAADAALTAIRAAGTFENIKTESR